ncbi:aldehyde dehydrogenase family protein [Aeromicrobium sp.]|uniref:aldehyde dehydrogenase family protein n=1 Tax=Aeromicrobium sp. TaxID=1871063 RepID=UPI002FCCAB51
MSFFSFSPTTGETVAEYGEATTEEINDAVEQAAEVHRSGTLSDPGVRSRLLGRLAKELRGVGDAIDAIAHIETGLPVARLGGEFERACVQLEMFADLVESGVDAEAIIDTADQTWLPVARPDLRRMLVPLGPVAVFGASNFPLAFSTAGGDTAAALASGCPVVVKEHPSHPGTADIVAGAAKRAVAAVGLPPRNL